MGVVAGVDSVVDIEGSIFPMKVHRFFEEGGESEVNLGVVESAGSALAKLAREEWRLYAVG